MGEDWERPLGGDVGRIRVDTGRAGEQYVEHLVGTIDVPLTGLRIAVDCANGAASEVGPAALRAAGADVVVINASPDGRNINEKCGSTHPEQLQAAVVASGADLGVAFDGDADRCLAVDASGVLVDGDQIMGILAIAMRDRGDLVDDTLVTTVMSNLGLKIAMTRGRDRDDRHRGRRPLRARGDARRRVLPRRRAVRAHHHGGARDHRRRGADGAPAGRARRRDRARPIAELAGVVRRLPQTLVNVPGVDKRRADDGRVRCSTPSGAAEAGLGDTGRVLLRSSGTEDLVRVMVEAGTQAEADRVAHELADVVLHRLAL